MESQRQSVHWLRATAHRHIANHCQRRASLESSQSPSPSMIDRFEDPGSTVAEPTLQKGSHAVWFAMYTYTHFPGASFYLLRQPGVPVSPPLAINKGKNDGKYRQNSRCQRGQPRTIKARLRGRPPGFGLALGFDFLVYLQAVHGLLTSNGVCPVTTS